MAARRARVTKGQTMPNSTPHAPMKAKPKHPATLTGDVDGLLYALDVLQARVNALDLADAMLPRNASESILRQARATPRYEAVKAVQDVRARLATIQNADRPPHAETFRRLRELLPGLATRIEAGAVIRPRRAGDRGDAGEVGTIHRVLLRMLADEGAATLVTVEQAADQTTIPSHTLRRRANEGRVLTWAVKPDKAAGVVGLLDLAAVRANAERIKTNPRSRPAEV